MKENLKKFAQTYLIYIAVAVIWCLLLIFAKKPPVDFVYLIFGAAVGFLLLEINWQFLAKKEITDKLALFLLPLTVFVLTSTDSVFGRAAIVFLNLRLLVDKKQKDVKNDNPT
jgi:heme O synthase-like polyprenyltransferase